MELIAMKNFKEFNRVAFDFDKSDAFVYRVSTKEAWASGDGMQVLRIVRAYLNVDSMIKLHGEYCRTKNHIDYILPMWQFDETFNNDFRYIYPRVAGDFNLDDEYFYLDQIGQICSGTFEDAIIGSVSWEEIAKAILDGSLSKNIYDVAKMV